MINTEIINSFQITVTYLNKVWTFNYAQWNLIIGLFAVLMILTGIMVAQTFRK